LADPFYTSRTYIFTLDSLGLNHYEAVEILTDYLNLEAQHKRKIVKPTAAIGKKALVSKFNGGSSSQVMISQVPIQPNNFDCGIYLLHFAETFLSDPRRYFRTITVRLSLHF
jgi:Ulp1 family protease